MFLEFYQMREQPFGVSPDPRYLYLSESHREALASLFCGVEADCAFMALIAPPGLGKTTLAYQLLEKLQRTSRTVFLSQTQCNSRELLHYVLNDCGVDATGMDIVSTHRKLKEILSRERSAGRRFILVIDEAQNLHPDALEGIRLLSNFETPRAKLLQILLIGQPPLAHKLATRTLAQLQQRISVYARLQPFGPEDTTRYIAHRLRVVAYEGTLPFTAEALQMIADQSQGIPRNINGLCFNALSLGCAMRRNQVDAVMMKEVIADLDVRRLREPTAVTHHATPPVATAPILSYRGQPKIRLNRWAPVAASIAASMTAGVVLISSSSSPSGMDLIWQSKTKPPASARNAMASAEGSLRTVATSGLTPSRSETTDETLKSWRVDPVTPSNVTDTVVVRSGETLAQIALRTFGQYNGDILDQILKLNPAMTNPDHIESDQAIRLPRLSEPSNPPTASTANGASGMNWSTQ